jgi:hypothetical protein
MITGIAVALALLQGDPVALKYGIEKGPRDRIYAETRIGIKVAGSEAMANFVRSMHPFLSLEKLVMRSEGSHTVTGPKRHKVEYEEARIEARYDDEDLELDFQKGLPPDGLDQDKTKQMLWYLAAAGRTFTLSETGEYGSDDPNQDQNGEAMDLISLGIVRMPDGAVKEGDAWEKSWDGARTEKGKTGRYRFTQKLKVEKVEVKDGKRHYTIAGELSGKVAGPKDPTAEEAWTKCEGKTRTVIEAETGRIVSSEGSGKVVVYFRNTAETGGKQELTLTFETGGKLQAK